MKTSKSLVAAQHVIPLFPLADETKSPEHAIFSLRVARDAILRATVNVAGGGPDAAFADRT